MASAGSAGSASTSCCAGTGNTGSRWFRFRTGNGLRGSEFRFPRSRRRCISCSPTVVCSPAQTRRRKCCACCGGGGSRPSSWCPGCAPWPGGSTPGLRGSGAVRCGAPPLTKLRDDGMEQKESSMTAPAALTAEVVRHALRQVKDPELDVNIVDLGLEYDIAVAGCEVGVIMKLTSHGCTSGAMITDDACVVLRERAVV